MRTAELFMSGGHQAVSLPNDMIFLAQTQVAIFRDGDKIILQPIGDDWANIASNCDFLPFSGQNASDRCGKNVNNTGLF